MTDSGSTPACPTEPRWPEGWPKRYGEEYLSWDDERPEVVPLEAAEAAYREALARAEAAEFQAKVEAEAHRSWKEATPQERIARFKRERDEALQRVEGLARAVGGMLWVWNNRHNAGTEQWEEYGKAAEKDARQALSDYGEEK